MIGKDTKIMTHIGSLSVKSISSAKILNPEDSNGYGEAQRPKTKLFKGMCYHINAGYTRDIIADDSQMFYVRRKDVFDDLGEPQWLSIRDIERGDYVCYPIIKAQNKPDIDILQDENIFYLLGRYAAGGYALYNSLVVQGEVNPRLMVALNKLNIDCHSEDNGVLVESLTLWKWCIRHIGNVGKTIDAAILCLSNNYLRFFLEGYIDGNSERFDDGIVFIARTYNMATGLAQCIAKVYGLPTKIQPYTYADNQTTTEYNVIMYNNSDAIAEVDSRGIWYEVKSKQSHDDKIRLCSINGTYIANNLLTKEDEKQKYL